MATTDLGKIGFVLKGAYSAETAYEKLDVVTYNNGSYAAKQTTTGNLPTDTTYWQPIADLAAVNTATTDANEAAAAANAIVTSLTASIVPTSEEGESVQDKLDEVDSQLAEIALTRIKVDDIFQNRLLNGMVPAIAAGLTSNISAGTAYVNGKRIATVSTSHTYTASKDTYIDLDDDGAYIFTEVNNGAAMPSISANAIRIAKVSTNANNISLVSSTERNTAYGTGALYQKGLSQYNTAIGYLALYSNNPDGSTDAALYNTAVGHGSLSSNTIGNHNTAVGFGSSTALTTGSYNTSVGEDALLSATTPNNCTAIGCYALRDNTIGAQGTALGQLALSKNTTGHYNTGVGYGTGVNNFGSVGSCTTDTQMTFIGAMASVDKSVNSGPFTNATAIGSLALVDNSNKIQLGNANVNNVSSHGDFEAQDIGDGFVCKSPNGTRYRITVADGGTVAVAEA